MELDLDALLEKADSKYTIVVVSARRGRQLVDGAPVLEATDSKKPVSIAFAEILADRLEWEGPEG